MNSLEGLFRLIRLRQGTVRKGLVSRPRRLMKCKPSSRARLSWGLAEFLPGSETTPPPNSCVRRKGAEVRVVVTSVDP
jgi:hypothetical protein